MEEFLCHDETFNSIQLSIPLDNERQISVDPQSLNLPASSSSTPLWSSRKQKNQSHTIISISHRFSAELPELAKLHALQLRRSKSCGDGRSSSPSDDFDIMSKKPTINHQQYGVQVLYNDSSNSSSDETDLEPNPSEDERFKCSALCLFFPGIYKKKSVLQTKTDSHNNNLEAVDRGSNLSKVASFEKFECGSWTSTANLDHDESGPLSYFDLPLELIRCSANESCSPVKSAFVFDKDLKGVLKKNSVSRLGSRKSCESNNRHVRFSTSSPTSYPASPNLSPCITPRLMKARNEFNALLEATSKG
ncbi:uncharacterized protein LOC110110994 [Dendrobium catenatum]|uniref:Uncharacterized protein n=1 Tax=Dendrobium catenatum TaxID=906689 RepID=A0A2I0W350_9ASPA|nr:uncharacterized protein LOC110110994 [Dendrobium catenatum]PKU70090.1 hypothetical protein MA16_Dca016374 [Dendrobium catenatum]